MPRSEPTRYSRRRIAAAAVVLAAAAGGAGFAFAQHVGGPHGHGAAAAHHAQHLEMMLDAVGAAGAQRAEIEAALVPAFEAIAVFHGTHAAVAAELVDALGAPAVDRARIEALRVELLRTLDAESQRLMGALGAAAEILSPEQRATLAAAILAHLG